MKAITPAADEPDSLPALWQPPEAGSGAGLSFPKSS